MTDFSSTEDMQAEFHRLTQEKIKIENDLGPLREKRDAFVQQYREGIAKLNTQIREKSEPLFEIDMKRGALVRALKGKTGKP